MTMTTAPGVTILDAVLSSGTGVEFPDLNASGANRGFFGPNVLFTVVPEPVSTALVAGALLVFAMRRRIWPALGVMALCITVHADPASTLAATPRPELPAVAARIVAKSPSSRAAVLAWVAAHRPASISGVRRALSESDANPAENRPPVTPGNDNGNRPVTPPGLNKYATP
jgi:hypothetical protein